MWRRSFCTTTATASAALNNKKWDALVIGGGHNGLTAAAYLAQSGLSVAVLERRHLIGGAAITEELIPGFKFSRCSYLQSLLRPSIIRDLELGRHGLKLLKRSPSSFTPCLDGRYLLLGPDAELNHSEISKFSKRDADAYPRYENQLETFCKFMDPLIDSSPPEAHQGVSSFNARLKHKLQKSEFWAHCLHQSVSMGQQGLVDFMDLLLSPASKVLNNWFESEVLKATLATDAVIGATASTHTPGSGYVLLHHVMGETDGDRGIWSYVEGGMGSVSLAIGNAAKEAGATIVTNAEVSKLMIEDSGTVTGVILADGTQVHASVVLSNATPYKTFMELVPESALPDDFSRAVKHSDYGSATTKINLAVDKLPQFQCCNLGHPEAGPQHMGTIHICSESIEEIDSACLDAKNGLPSRRPIIEMTIPSVLDKTISPPDVMPIPHGAIDEKWIQIFDCYLVSAIGKHVINLFVQFTPYKPNDGSWEDPAYRESFAQRCFKLIDEYAPGFSSSVIGYDMLAPPDLERIIGLTGGNIFHGAMGLDSLFLMRPVKGCGSHPGGGVMGAPGRNAARVVIDDIKG
ncbi:FAD dependent oxidoreductase [Cynara cardunculus var. scolymus]|uniref:Pyridine nucleotide-disulfide oxidoreductase domain-containing protein 2 n=1 Tax=Cynara cardunculus var. scolymus TaxID=59895 RepID=A0A103XKF3_CYNCS|nr:FAD dependent oxidoreductase [Cynara cardunculus var. scolymus]